jgi:dTDP-glucose pyrophosphorylase
MSCNISIEKYIFSVEKVSRLGIKKFIHYVFVGDVSPDIEKVLKKLENRQNLKISCIEEIAYKKKFISRSQLKKRIKFYERCFYSDY